MPVSIHKHFSNFDNTKPFSHRTMKSLLYLCLFLLLATIHGKAQDFLPFASFNYAGITGVHLQPACIVDSRYRIDLALSSTSLGFTNNFYGLDPYVLKHPSLLKDIDFNGPYISRNKDGNDKSGIFSVRQDVFSFMISLSNKDAIAFTPSVRSIFNIDNMSETTAVLLDQLDKETDLWKIKLRNENVNAQLNAWVEYGLTYARVIMDNKKHFLKAGTTVKINHGIASGYMFIKDLNYEVNGQDTISLYNSRTNYGVSNNLADGFSYSFVTNLSVSFDFGVVYEYRPNWMKYKYDMNGKTNLWRRDEDKYLFRLGFTMSDLGSVRYKRDPLSRDFNADIQKWDVGNLGISSLSDFNALIDSTFNVYDVAEDYRMNLPLSLSLQADVRVAKGLYINFTPYLAINKVNENINKVHYISSFNIIPRYDKKRFGISVPVQYNQYKQWYVGLGVRIGPLWVGWNDFFTAMTSSKFRYGSTASVVLKMPLYYHRPQEKETEKAPDK